MQSTHQKLGILVALGAATFFAISNSLARLAYIGGSNPDTLAFSRFYLPAIILYVILKFSKKPILLPKKDGWISAVLGLLTGAYALALLISIGRLPVAIAILIFYLFPILTGLIIVTFGWARLSATIIIGALVAFTGLVLALGVEFKELDTLGMIFDSLAAIGMAVVSSISGRMIHGQDPRQVTFYIVMGAIGAMLIYSQIGADIVLPNSPKGWSGLLFSNLFFAAAIIFYFTAISMIGAARTALFSNLEPVLTVGTAFLFLGQSILPLQMVGIAIVVGALIYASRAN